MKGRTLGIDLGKTSRHAVGLNDDGHVVVQRRFLAASAHALCCEVAPCRLGAEAYCRAHHLGDRRASGTSG